jgi:hypothetical protein
MAPPQSITVIDPLPWLRSTATRLALSELVTAGQLAANEDGRPPAWIKPGEGPGAQPVVRVRRQLRPLPRARLRGASEPLPARVVLPLRRGAAKLRAECHLAGGHIRRCLQEISRDPSELGSLGLHLSRGAAHRHHAVDEDPIDGEIPST